MKSKHQRVLSDEYLRTYSAEHLWYEVSMFFDTGLVLPHGVTSPQVEFVDDAVLESFAIHLRNLLNFFYPDHVQPDDVIAADYFDSGQTPLMQEIANVIGAFVAGASAHKLDPEFVASAEEGPRRSQRFTPSPTVAIEILVVPAVVPALAAALEVEGWGAGPRVERRAGSRVLEDPHAVVAVGHDEVAPVISSAIRS